jgi:hypothetical protein
MQIIKLNDDYGSKIILMFVSFVTIILLPCIWSLYDGQLINSYVLFLFGSVFVCGIILLWSIFVSGYEYPCEMRIDDSSLKIVYKRKHKISQIKELDLAEIKKIKFDINAKEQVVNYELHFLCKNPKKSIDIEFGIHKLLFFVDQYSLFYQMCELKEILPNLTCNVSSIDLAEMIDLETYFKDGIHTKNYSENNNKFNIIKPYISPVILIILGIIALFVAYNFGK